MLALLPQTPAQAVAADAALRRLKPTADQLAAFQKQLARLLRHLDPAKIERHGETHILDFLRDTTPALADGGPAERYGNVNGRRDLALHLGDTADSPVAVSIEVKGPKNPQEMLAPDDLNRKAFQQLLLYYLEDRTDDRAADATADTADAAEAAVDALVAARYGFTPAEAANLARPTPAP